MRLISQDGMIDVPYEYGSLSVGVGKVEEIEHAVIKYRNASSPVGTKLAEYSSKAKALKVMEMLRNAYVGLPILFQNVDMDESVVDKLKEWKRDGIVLLHDNADSKIEQVNNAIFKFPDDSEVEV